MGVKKSGGKKKVGVKKCQGKKSGGKKKVEVNKFNKILYFLAMFICDDRHTHTDTHTHRHSHTDSSQAALVAKIVYLFSKKEHFLKIANKFSFLPVSHFIS